MNGNHLVQKEIEVDLGHLPNNQQKLPKPYIDLLACRRVEDPLLLIIEKLGEPCRVAVFLAVVVIRAVLVNSVKHVHRKRHLKEMAVLNVD